jgi:porphobilinogen synthase
MLSSCGMQMFPGVLVITDLCLCAYTDTGHCGVWDYAHGCLDNAASIARLASVAVKYCAAGAQVTLRCMPPSTLLGG